MWKDGVLMIEEIFNTRLIIATKKSWIGTSSYKFSINIDE